MSYLCSLWLFPWCPTHCSVFLFFFVCLRLLYPIYVASFSLFIFDCHFDILRLFTHWCYKQNETEGRGILQTRGTRVCPYLVKESLI